MNNNEGTTWWALGLDNAKFESDVAKSNSLFRSIGNTAEKEGSRIDNIFRKITVAATGFFTAQQALGYAQKIAQVRGEYQQLEVAFNTMLGSKAKADALMTQLINTAAKTPFDLVGVSSSAKQLLAYGIAADKVNDTLVRLGNIAAGLSIPLQDIAWLYGTTMTQGRLYAEDLNQFTGRGIPMIRELAKELGVAENEVKALVAEGKVGFPEVQKVIENLTNSGGMFYNLMEEQSKTITGKISNMEDAISVMLNEIGQANESTINSILETGVSAIENYEAIGATIQELIVTYGLYKAAVISVAATKNAVTTIKATGEAEELSKLLTVEQQAAISKKNLTKGTLEYATAVKAEMAANIEAQTVALAKARTEVSAASQAVAAKKAEYLAAKELEKQRLAELMSIGATGSAKQVEAAERKLVAAETARETAALQYQAATRDFSTKKVAVETAAKTLNTTQTAANTAAQAANVTTTNLLATAKLKLMAVATRLKAVMLANPYTLAAAAIAALGYGIYKLITYQTDAEKAQEKLNNSISESEKVIGAERLQIDAMFARLKAAKEGTDEYRSAKEAIMSKYGEYLKGLGDEKNALDDLAKAYRIITQEAEKSARARAMDKAVNEASNDYIDKEVEAKETVEELLKDKFKGKKDKDGIDLAETYYWKIKPVLEGKGEITQEIQDIIKQFDETKYLPGDPMTGIGAQTYMANSLQDEITKVFKARGIYNNIIKEAQKRFGENPNQNQKTGNQEEVFYTKGKSISEIEAAITKGQEKLEAFKKALKENNGLMSDGKVVTDAVVKGQESYIAKLKATVLERENELQIISQVENRISKLKQEQKETVKGSAEYNDYQRRIDSLSKKLPDRKTSSSQKDYSDEIKRNAQEQIRIEKDMEFAVRQAEINTHKEGLSKTLEQNQLNYEQEMEQIKRQKEDKLTKIQEWEKTIWESQGKKGTFKPTTTQLSEQDEQQFKALENAAGKKLSAGNQTAIEEMLKQYQAYAEKRKEIEEKFQQDIDEMRAVNEKDKKAGKQVTFSEENIAQAESDKQDALDALDQEIASREATFNVWVEQISSMGLKQLKEALQTAQDTLKKEGGKLDDKEKATLRAQIKTLEKKVEVAEAKDASTSSAEKNKKKWSDTLKVMNEVDDTVNNIISDFDGMDDATKAALSAATNIAGGIISMITGIQALAVTGAEAIKGVERASVILSIVGTAISLITTLFGLSSKAEKEHQEALKEVAENKLEMQRQYNLLLMEQNLLMKEATSIFGEDQIAKAARSVEVYRQAIEDYKETLKGDAPTLKLNPFNLRGSLNDYKKQKEAYDKGVGALNNVTVKTGSYTTGAWFWKKQHDIYTSVLQVYPDLIDGENKLNKERAQAILDTQTMSDENRNLLQNLIDLQEQAEEAQQALRDYLEGTFGSLGDSIMDSITEAIENDGVDAWEKFGEKGSSVLEDLGKQIAYSLFFSDKFKRLQADLEKIYGSGKTEEEIAKEARDLVASFYQGIGTDMNNAQQWMEHWKEEANKQGFHLWETENREVSSNNGIAASQDSVNELNGRATAIQGHTYSINEGIKSLVSHCAKFLEILTGIRENTSYCKNLESINSNIKEMKESIGNMNDKGVIMRK
ncbi:tape measure protein [Bacteroides intestinalis]|uniref:tape measure protein n=1 Tax=Bacteroides intestinalis TaxID=329854 RepID=UPI001D07B918|nr:tape measure protein [Bacteroides intestinalis]MCB6678550.1 tape measure protein [Bacteroides intestinalis]MCB7016141.1 tape measure protein [Bacteroides intestinalis]MCG4703230.1 tape measure protein [Bacteroides intestinalis]MCG4718862.1 tape measure protein [Bacteroides intestinalis]MCG4735633.1 tape measure protein [Bacteroides intestinalis]